MRKPWVEGERWVTGMTCPRCESPAPHLHPAVQHEGEVQPCSHAFHQQVTSSNTLERIAQTADVMERISA